MKNIKILVVIFLVVVAGYAIFARSSKNGPTAVVPTNVSSGNWVTFVDAGNGFSFQYPENWLVTKCESKDCVFSVIGEAPEMIVDVPISLDVSVSTTTQKDNAESRLNVISKIITSQYVTPSGMGGVDTDYEKESTRWSVESFLNKEGVKIYHSRYIGKYGVITDGYYFDTNKAKTISFFINNGTLIKKSGVSIEDRNAKEIVSSIKVF